MDKIGPVFPEFITTEKIKRKGNYHDHESPRGMRFFLVPLILVFGLGLIILRLAYLQVLQGNYYRNLADNNRVKTVVVHAPRGTIFDRNGNPLVFNTPGYRLVEKDKTKLLTQEDAVPLLAKGEKNLEIDSLRDYPEKESMAHLLGYLGQISEDELKMDKYAGYKSGDIIGKMGIESQYENFLKGQDGRQLAEINSAGQVVRKLGETDPIPGRNIKLTVDRDLQEKAYKAISKVKKGAVVVSTPKGEILALVSNPSFDPNLFTQGLNYKTATDSAYQSVQDIINDGDNQPFLNRPISGVYPPGSTFKIITSAAGLENNIIDTKYSVKDTGVIKIGEFSFANWYYTNNGGTDGEVNVIKGLKRSNDIFYYKLAEKVGLSKLSAMSREFGIDKDLGIDLEGEARGIVPTDEWKRKNIGEPWFLGDTYHYGIGQGYLLTTPLDVNAWAEVIANGGTLYRPYLLKDLGEQVINKNFLSKKTIEPIRQGMIEACAPTGVAWPLFDFKVKNSKLKIDGKNFTEAAAATTSAGFKDYRHVVVACKTGTAQHGGEKTLPHSWITLFAPAYDPQIVVTVLAEESGEGSNIAAPIAKEILTEWFKR